MTRILIGLGSNIDPENHLNAAAVMLRERWPTVRFSSVYRSKPWGFEDQPDFLNAAALIEADHKAKKVLEALQEIEEKRGRATTVRCGPRTIDLDLLLHGTTIVPSTEEWHQIAERPNASYTLTLPHPRMHERRFVLVPVMELVEPLEMHPVLGKSWEELLKGVAEQEMQRMPMQL
jgi:2-amino-4-hydroxy-6-hydroxymethyldihydropteridine diphosphokinase